MLRKIALAFALVLVAPSPAFAQDGPAVKMSTSGICHERGSTYYSRTKNFTAYKSMAACLSAGGREPRR